jgi:TonB family protein
MLIRLCILQIIISVLSIATHAQGDNGVRMPKLIEQLSPVYPQEIRDAGIGGKVVVRVSVGETGNVLSVGDPTGPAHLCKGGNNDPRLVALRQSVVDAVKKARFTPPMKDGKPVKMTVWVGVTFEPVIDGGGVGGGAGERRIVKVGVVTGKALRMPKPEYPAAARSRRAAGAVAVRVVIDEKGDVFTAEAITGHPLLQPAAVEAACKAKFSPTAVDGSAVRITGVITYNFVP